MQYPRRCPIASLLTGLSPAGMAASLAALDQTGPLWASGALVGKVGSVFTGSATQHGGQESTILTMIPTLLHHGMIVVGLPYAFEGTAAATNRR
jgi:multimeric flavodoxin WrbA